jgi:steroid 5-alpha reductase family enzyme
MENVLGTLGMNLLAALAFMMCIGWPLSLLDEDASVADVFWGLGFIVIAFLTYAQTDGAMARRLLLVGLTTAWGLRLTIHIYLRKQGKGEDARYRKWRLQHPGRYWIVSLFTVFALQGALLWVVSLSVQVGQMAGAPAGLTVLDGLGALVWCVGFFFEAVGDWQLARFKKNPENRGKVMDRGLWRYTRHPNYFGESVMWWGIYLIALSTPHGWWTIISPITITVLLLRVSGVPLLERTIREERPQYRDYERRTNAFIPWFPKKEAS